MAENIPDSCYSSPDTFGEESGFNEKKKKKSRQLLVLLNGKVDFSFGQCAFCHTFQLPVILHAQTTLVK